MYPIARSIAVFLRAINKPKVGLFDALEIRFICRPWDLDMFFELNNGRALTLYDLGRLDLIICTGLSQVLKDNGWGMVVAGSTVRYRKRIRLFDKVTIKTQLTNIDERWIYINQSMWVKGEPCSSVLLRTGVTAGGKVISPSLVKPLMGIDETFKGFDSDYLDKWLEAESIRPWPPET